VPVLPLYPCLPVLENLFPHRVHEGEEEKKRREKTVIPNKLFLILPLFASLQGGVGEKGGGGDWDVYFRGPSALPLVMPI